MFLVFRYMPAVETVDKYNPVIRGPLLAYLGVYPDEATASQAPNDPGQYVIYAAKGKEVDGITPRFELVKWLGAAKPEVPAIEITEAATLNDLPEA